MMPSGQHSVVATGSRRDAQRTMRGLELPGLTFFGLLALMIVSLGPGMSAMSQASAAGSPVAAPTISAEAPDRIPLSKSTWAPLPS